MGLVLFKWFGFIEMRVIDVIDIALVTFFLYKMYFMMRRTRAIQMFIGLVFIFIISLFTQALQMREMNWIFWNLRTIWLVGFVILFQPELRRLLTNMGQSRLFRFFTKAQTSAFVEEIIKGVMELSKRGYGGLIVLVRDTGLKSIVEAGILIQANVHASLIVSIFNPRSPLHDGAIIIQNQIIEAAKCILPLTRTPQLDQSMGTRHRAAIGISEESDALVLVVSEETGTISMVENGEMVRGLDLDTLSQSLNTAFSYSVKAGLG
jgi:diadenylate cyclase